MKHLIVAFACLISICAYSQNTWIQYHGFTTTKIFGSRLLAEYDNRFFTVFSEEVPFVGFEYTIAEYDTLGNYINRKVFSNNLFAPNLVRSESYTDSSFCSIFQGPIDNYYRVLRKAGYKGSIAWTTSQDLNITDFAIHENKTYTIGLEKDTTGSWRQALIEINSATGLVSQRRYFTDYIAFEVTSDESDFRVLEISAIDSSLFVLINRKSDSAKFIYEFDFSFNFLSSFQIEQDAFRILKNNKRLILYHQWLTPDLINKGRAVAYGSDSVIDWTLEINKENLEYLFGPRRAIAEERKTYILTHNYDAIENSAFQDVYVLNDTGKILSKFRLESSQFHPNISLIKKLKDGFLMQTNHTDFAVELIKTDTCFNAQHVERPERFLNFPECGDLNSSVRNLRGLEYNYSVFPNPTSTQFTIQTNSNKQIQYSLYSLNGQEVTNGNFVSQTQIDVSEFTKGVYLLHLQSEEGVEVKKLVVR